MKYIKNLFIILTCFSMHNLMPIARGGKQQPATAPSIEQEIAAAVSQITQKKSFEQLLKEAKKYPNAVDNDNKLTPDFITWVMSNAIASNLDPAMTETLLQAGISFGGKFDEDEKGMNFGFKLGSINTVIETQSKQYPTMLAKYAKEVKATDVIPGKQDTLAEKETAESLLDFYAPGTNLLQELYLMRKIKEKSAQESRKGPLIMLIYGELKPLMEAEWNKRGITKNTKDLASMRQKLQQQITAQVNNPFIPQGMTQIEMRDKKLSDLLIRESSSILKTMQQNTDPKNILTFIMTRFLDQYPKTPMYTPLQVSRTADLVLDQILSNKGIQKTDVLHDKIPDYSQRLSDLYKNEPLNITPITEEQKSVINLLDKEIKNRQNILVESLNNDDPLDPIFQEITAKIKTAFPNFLNQSKNLALAHNYIYTSLLKLPGLTPQKQPKQSNISENLIVIF